MPFWYNYGGRAATVAVSIGPQTHKGMGGGGLLCKYWVNAAVSKPYNSLGSLGRSWGGGVQVPSQVFFKTCFG